MVRHDGPDVFHDFNEGLSRVLQLVAFAVFGALVIATGWEGNTLALAVFMAVALFVVRPASVLVAFAGVRMSRPEKLFVAWFGPKGIASMLFALFVLNSSAPDRTLVFDVAAFTILASILAHGSPTPSPAAGSSGASAEHVMSLLDGTPVSAVTEPLELVSAATLAA